MTTHSRALTNSSLEDAGCRTRILACPTHTNVSIDKRLAHICEMFSLIVKQRAYFKTVDLDNLKVKLSCVFIMLVDNSLSKLSD